MQFGHLQRNKKLYFCSNNKLIRALDIHFFFQIQPQRVFIYPENVIFKKSQFGRWIKTLSLGTKNFKNVIFFARWESNLQGNSYTCVNVLFYFWL